MVVSAVLEGKYKLIWTNPSSMECKFKIISSRQHGFLFLLVKSMRNLVYGAETQLTKDLPLIAINAVLIWYLLSLRTT